MRLLKIGNLRIKEVYVCEPDEVEFARQHGLSWTILPSGWDDEKLAKFILLPVLEKLLPYYDWEKHFGIIDRVCVPTVVIQSSVYERDTGDTYMPLDINPNMNMTSDDPDTYRFTVDGGTDNDSVQEVDLDKYLGHEWEVDVNIDLLQTLGLMPKFMSDIASAIRHNISSVSWMDGWNKKLDAPLGTTAYGTEAPNLMVLDVSGSIPGGVAMTMVKLIDMLRHQANADLIITGRYSWWYGIGDPLPSPEVLAGMIGGANEVVQFEKILNTYVAGKHYGNLIVFGDDDAPTDDRFTDPPDFYGNQRETKDAARKIKKFSGSGATFDNIMAFHTRCIDKIPGYGRFAKLASPTASVTYDHEWTTYVLRKRKL